MPDSVPDMHGRLTMIPGALIKHTIGKLGVNAIGGVEYRFRFPLTLQADFRPGFGLLFNNHYNVTYFDWGLFVGARYIIQ